MKKVILEIRGKRYALKEGSDDVETYWGDLFEELSDIRDTFQDYPEIDAHIRQAAHHLRQAFKLAHDQGLTYE